jgi:hypothetical protein
VVGLAHIAYLAQRRREPGFGLQRGGNHVVVGEHGALGQAGGAAGVLQEGNGIVVHRGRLQRPVVAVFQCSAERDDGSLPLGALERQLECGHHFAQVAHSKRDPAAVPETQHIAQAGHHHMLHAGVVNHFFQRVGKVLQNDYGLGARVFELVAQLARRIQRVHVHAGVAGSQNAGHGHQELRHVGQHDGHAGARGQPQPLQVGAQRGAHAVELAVGHPGVHAHRDRRVGVALEGVFPATRSGSGIRQDRSRGERRAGNS